MQIIWAVTGETKEHKKAFEDENRSGGQLGRIMKRLGSVTWLVEQYVRWRYR